MYSTLSKWIRSDREMCETLTSMDFIRNAENYLNGPTQATNRAEEEGSENDVGSEGGGGGGEKRLTLKEKIGLMGLIREVVSGGGEIEEREEVMRGIEGVMREGRERGDSEGMLAEEEGERLLWVIEKKRRGREMKSRREIDRMREEEVKKREEAERRESEEVKKREELERENEQLKREIEMRISLIKYVSETVVKIPNREITIQEGNRFHNKSDEWETIIIGNKMSRV